MSKWDDRPEEKAHSPENNCEECYKKKYCGKPCRARKNYENNLIQEAVAKMQGEQKIKEALEGSKANMI